MMNQSVVVSGVAAYNLVFEDVVGGGAGEMQGQRQFLIGGSSSGTTRHFEISNTHLT